MTITFITTSPCLSAYYIYVCPVLVVWGWRAHIARYQHLESHNGTNWPGLLGKKDEFGYQEALILYPVFSAQVRRLLSVEPTLLPSRRQLMHRSLPFQSTQGPPGHQRAQRRVSSSGLGFLKATSHLPFLKLLPEHSEREGTDGLICYSQCRIDPRLPGRVVLQQWACHMDLQAEDLGQEDQGPPQPQRAGVASAVAGEVANSMADRVGHG